MIISDLNYLEEVVVEESHDVEGGLLNLLSSQTNQTPIGQDVNNNVGNGLLAVGNVGLGINLALPIQVNV